MHAGVRLMLYFFLFLNVWSGALILTGVADSLGLEAQTGNACTDDVCVGEGGSSPSVNETVEPGVPSSSTGTLDTLQGLYTSVTDWAAVNVINVIVPAIGMLERLGVPIVITRRILQPVVGVMVTLYMADYLVGR